jgi:membrane protease YdiL (CAAX protease family)
MNPGYSPAPIPSWFGLSKYPGTRGVLFMLLRIVAFIAFAFAIGWALRKALPMPRMAPDKALAMNGSELWLYALRGVVPGALAYWLLARLVERRKVADLQPAKFPMHVATGWLLGTAIMVVAALAMVAAGAMELHTATSPANLIGPFVILGLMPGITEEIIARGILFRVVEEGLGSWFALVFSAALFGGGHFANPNATAWSSIAIAIEAGLLLGMAYAWTRSLWFVMALHAAWNFTQGGLLGIPVSGFHVDGLMTSSTHGPELLSGGAFGAEASVLTVVICTSLGTWFAYKAIKDGRIVRPAWSRKDAVHAD